MYFYKFFENLVNFFFVYFEFLGDFKSFWTITFFPYRNSEKDYELGGVSYKGECLPRVDMVDGHFYASLCLR